MFVINNNDCNYIIQYHVSYVCLSFMLQLNQKEDPSMEATLGPTHHQVKLFAFL